jgi:hypothetical protein
VLEVAAEKAPAGGELSCRATVKANHFGGVWSGLLMFGQSREHVLNAEWKTVELRTSAHEFWQADPVTPGAAPVLLAFDNQEIWIKDLEVWHIPGPPPEPREVKPGETVLRSFTFKDKPISTDYVNELEGGWRYQGPGKDYNDVRLMRLFRLRKADWQAVVPKAVPGTFILRLRLKTENVVNVLPEIRCDFPGPVQNVRSSLHHAAGSTDWLTYDVEFPVAQEPQAIDLNVMARGGGRFWIKDVDLLHVADQKPTPGGEVVLKRIDPKEKPFTTSGFFQSEMSEGQWAFHSDQYGRTVRLHVAEIPDVAGDELTLRARLFGGITGAFEPTGAYLQLICHCAAGAVVTSAKPTLLLKGKTSWQPFQAAIVVPKGMKLERVEMNLVMLPQLAESAVADYFVAIKDIELVKSPATGPPQPVVLKSFDSAKDKLLNGPLEGKDGMWTIAHKYADGAARTTERVPLFKITDFPIPKAGHFILRAKLKGQYHNLSGGTVPPKISAYLSIGPEPSKSAPQAGFETAAMAAIDWATYETSIPVSSFQGTSATVVPLDLIVTGTGTTWIKDIELLWLPE